MNEHGFIKAIHRKLPSEVFKWKIHDTYTGGVPDVMYGGPSGILFAEYKYIPKLPVRDTTLLKTTLAPLQIQWLNKMRDCGQSACVIVGIEDRAIILVKDFTANITKRYYNEHNISHTQLRDWIMDKVTSGATKNEQATQRTSS
jgi:hypothetical protein